MVFIPFPPQLAALSAQAASAAYESRKGQKAADHTTHGVACYQTGDGELHMAYDLYRAEYPEGAEPGIGNVHAKLEYYPNDTSGYRFTVTDFAPAHEVIENAKEWQNPAVAIVTTDGNEVFFVAPSQSRLDEIIHVPAGSDLPLRRPHVALFTELSSMPEAAIFMNPGGRDTVLLGTHMEIATALVEQFDVEMPYGDLPDESMLQEVCDRLNERYEFLFKMAKADNLVVMPEIYPQVTFSSEPEV